MNKGNKDKKYITTSEAANLLGISKTAVLKRIKKGDIKAYKVGNRNIIPYDYLMGKLSNGDKKNIDDSVEMAVIEYGETFKLLEKE